MKKIIGLLALFYLLCIGKIYALETESIWKGWRSSETATADTDVLIATGVIYVKDIIVASGTVSVAQLQLFNTTGTVAGGVSRSSSVLYDISSTGKPIEINQVYSKGLRYTKTGNSSIVIRWDWVLTVPKGQEKRGLK